MCSSWANDHITVEHAKAPLNRMNELKRTILELLASGRVDARLSGGHHCFFEALKNKIGKSYKRHIALQEVWQMIGNGLIYVDIEQPAPGNWELVIAEKGRDALASGHDFNPYDPDGYIARLKKRIPHLDDIVLLYAMESLRSFNSECYLSALVMLGVASEKAFLLLAESFALWLPKGQSERFLAMVLNPKQNFLAKFSEFRKRIEPLKPSLPPEFSDNMALTLDSVCDLIRIYRNESGHPTGKVADKGDAFITLQMFATYLQKIFGLISFFRISQKTE